jgi:Tol biopolymer transport system component
MTFTLPSLAPRRLAAVLSLAVASAAVAPTLEAQYFGQNKVQYEHFDFSVLRSPHFDVHYYEAEAEAARDATRMLERWNARYTLLFAHPLSARKPIVLYADQPDFQQTNVVSGILDEGTGGVTESLLDRMVLPLTGSYAESDHVLGHEMVHVFQYDVSQRARDGVGRMEQLPLWLVEGMAEYLSVGRDDPNTAMWMRDAVLRNDIPTIRKLESGRYFPYRYGEAVWAFIGRSFGDEMVPRLFRESLRTGFPDALERLTDLRVDTLSARWAASLRQAYGSDVATRVAPRDAGDRIGFDDHSAGSYHVSPSASPDGRLVAYFADRRPRGIELVVADAESGKRVTTLAAPGVSSHFDALSFLYSAGAWSPDSRRFAFVVYADGDNEIDVVDAASHKTERRIRPKGVGAISALAWSPDGGRLVFSGQAGGVSDLYVHELASGATRRLMSDRFADLHPTFSPDGRSIAFATDRPGAPVQLAAAGGMIPAAGCPDRAGTDLESLRYAPLRLATIDLDTHEIRVLPGFCGAKHINPQYSADGRSLFFVSDPDGVSDVYRLELATGALSRVTRVATGVSGVTATSPAISIAAQTGRLFFSVFSNAGFQLVGLDAARTVGTPLTEPALAVVAGAEADTTGAVAAYLRDPVTGLPPDGALSERPYRPLFRLGALGQPSLGVAVGGAFGTQVGGSASAYFLDMLGDQSLGVAVQASGTARDIGGEVLYLNTAHRWNWGVDVGRIPYLASYAYLGGNGSSINYLLERITISTLSGIAQYPLSTTRRIELSAGYAHYGYDLETYAYSNNGQISRTQNAFTTPSSLGLATGSLAYVGDRSFAGYTSPLAGTRYRFEVTPTIGSLRYNTALADFRHYVLIGPLTLAGRAMHYGRYGRDAESDRLGSIFLGNGSLVRGYSYGSFSSAECNTGTGQLSGSTCAEFDRLLGSRLALANLELRIPLIGTQYFGLLRTNALPPLEVAPFVDVGAAWTSTSKMVWQLDATSTDRTPVASTGIASRLNLFGLAVLEIYYAHPLQRPTKSGVWGFQLQPGW